MKAQATIDHISNWILNYAQDNGIQGLLVGISGGIDSAVTSTLCAQTNLEVLLVEMPIHQEAKQVQRGKKHIDNLKERYSNVRSTEMDLTPTYEQFISSLPIQASGPSHDMSLVNTRARLRMSCLYYFAALHAYIVVGTGNKVEDFGIGFYTKYGDGGVDISPIADLNKTEVYALGKELGIIDEIMNAPPTDGLWGDDRSDEDQIGASYPELEWAMEYGGAIEDVSGRKKEVLQIYRRLNRINQHKMQPIPVCEIPVEFR